jgi:hypothetical protein
MKMTSETVREAGIGVRLQVDHCGFRLQDDYDRSASRHFNLIGLFGANISTSNSRAEFG